MSKGRLLEVCYQETINAFSADVRTIKKKKDFAYNQEQNVFFSSKCFPDSFFATNNLLLCSQCQKVECADLDAVFNVW